MSHQQDQEYATPRTNSLAPQGNSNEQKPRYKKSHPNNANGDVTYSHNYHRLMRLGRKRTLALQITAGADNYLDRNLHSAISKGSSSVARSSNRSGNRCLSLRTAVKRWLSDTSAAAMTQGVDVPAPTADEASSQSIIGVSSQASNAFSHISATPTPPGLVRSQAIGANASSISGLSVQPALRTSTPVPGLFSVISAASLASETISSQTFSRSVSTISGASSHSEFGIVSLVPRTSATQISGTNSLISVDSRPHNTSVTSAAPTPSRRVPTQLRFNLPGPGRRNIRSTRDGNTGPRLTATEIQKLLVIPNALSAQRGHGKSKPGARIVPPRPFAERHRNGDQVEDAKPKLTVTELQKQFVIPQGVVTQKQYGKKAPGRTTNSFAKGSYARRLVEMMPYHRSEYSIWANATSRKFKLLGSSEPVAVVEVISISRNMRLQWAKCKVISSNTTKPLFGFSSIRTRLVLDDCRPSINNGRIEPVSLVDSDASERRSDWTAPWGGRSGSLNERLMNVDNKSASLSRCGFRDSEGMPTDDKNPGKERRVFYDLQSRGLGQVRSPRRSPHLSKGTQGSEGDDISKGQGQRSSMCDTHAGSGLLFHALDKPTDASCFNGLSGSGDTPLAKNGDYQDAEIDGIKNNATMEVEVQAVKALDRTISVLSSIDGGSSDFGELQAVVPLNPQRETGNQQKETTTSLSMTVESKPTFNVIFSNLFNHSTLKAADRVEIHEPCRPVALSGSDPADCVWIVERYVVGWQKISL